MSISFNSFNSFISFMLFVVMWQNEWKRRAGRGGHHDGVLFSLIVIWQRGYLFFFGTDIVVCCLIAARPAPSKYFADGCCAQHRACHLPILPTAAVPNVVLATLPNLPTAVVPSVAPATCHIVQPANGRRASMSCLSPATLPTCRRPSCTMSC